VGERGDGGGVGDLGAHEARVEGQDALAGDERVERETVGEVVGGVDDGVPQDVVERGAGLGGIDRRQPGGERDDLRALCVVGVAGGEARRSSESWRSDGSAPSGG
jgi:hypothetical protein